MAVEANAQSHEHRFEPEHNTTGSRARREPENLYRDKVMSGDVRERLLWTGVRQPSHDQDV